MTKRGGLRADAETVLPPTGELPDAGETSPTEDVQLPAVAPAEPMTRPDGGGSYVRDRATGHLTRQEA